MTNADIKEGDHVRVVFEGEVTKTWPSPSDHGFNVDDVLFPNLWVRDHVKSVEKIEPPVTTFGPGDLVRHRHDGTLRALGGDGYFLFADGGFHTYLTQGFASSDFTSELFEKVDLDADPR